MKEKESPRVADQHEFDMGARLLGMMSDDGKYS